MKLEEIATHPPPDPRAARGAAESPKAGRASQRDLLFDAMKGFGILLVILGHALQSSLPQFDENFAFRLIYSFHMPLFFFISGYIFQFTLAGKPLAPIPFLLKKARALALPCLSWYLIFGVWRGIPSGMSLSDYARRFFVAPAFGFWFLWVLFLCFAAMLPLAWLQQRIKAAWHPALMLLSWLTFYLLQCIKQASYGRDLLKIYYFYFAVGFFFCYWRKSLSSLKAWWPEICLLGFLLLVPYWRRAGEMPFQPFLKEHFPRKWVALTNTFDYTLALLGIGSIAQIVKAFLSGPVGRWLAWIGNYTLDIYVIHLWTFPIAPFGQIFYATKGDAFSIIMVVAWGLSASLAISFLLIRRSVILKFLFLGILDDRKALPTGAIS